MTLSVEVISASELTTEHIQCWHAFCDQNPLLDSPYFRPEFTQQVAQVRSDVEVALLIEAGATVGFFPFQRGRFNAGKPVGGRLSDYHGVIGDLSREWPLERILPECRLRSFCFDHLMHGMHSLQTTTEVAGSPYIDLTQGFETYAATQKKYVKKIGEFQRKLRKLDRESQSFRFEMQCNSHEAFEQLIEWKVEQYQRTGAFNPLSHGWVRELLNNIWKSNSETFRGVFSTLYADDVLVGAHFGMQSRGVLHYWFPSYNSDYSKYSPGNVLLLKIAMKAAELGIQKIDLGKGDQDYKLAFASAQTPVSEGAIHASSLTTQLEKRYSLAKEWLRNSSLKQPAQWTANAIRPLREWWEFR